MVLVRIGLGGKSGMDGVEYGMEGGIMAIYSVRK